MNNPEAALTHGLNPLCSMGLFTRRVTNSLVGRSLELTAAEREMDAAQRGVVCLEVEGEPGIGKTLLLLSLLEKSRQEGFVAIGVTSDEEIRGPFLLARSVFGTLAADDVVFSSSAMPAVQRALDALSDIDDPSLNGLAPDRKLVRVFDIASVALRSVAAIKPLALLLDDIQWADEDSLRMLRYVIRTNMASRILLVLATRPNEVAFVDEAVTLMADVDRMGLLRRIKLSRFSQRESTEFIQQILGERVNPSAAAIMHAQSEGVPFILAEQVQAYRDAGLLQLVDGVWMLARNADRLLPSAVRTLIQRRAARLSEATKSTLAEAAVLGRAFSLRNLQDLKVRLGDSVPDTQQIAETLEPAVAAGLLNPDSTESPMDYRFSHEGVREYSAATLTPARRRSIHEAIIQILSPGGEPRTESFPLVAEHAFAAGRPDLGVHASIEAARNALRAKAPEEVLRLVALAQPNASSPKDRVALLQIQDDALEMLRRPAQRMEGLAQLAALAEALGDSHLEMEVMLRRCAALRMSQEYDRAADLAQQIGDLAAGLGDRQSELAACLELGQDLLKTEIGEGYVPTASEVDLDGAAIAFQRALELAEQLEDDRLIASASRELGVIAMARARAWFVEQIKIGAHIPILQGVAAGNRLESLLATLPVAPLITEAQSRYQRALQIYEQIGDRAGAMSTIIALAYIAWGPEIHLPGSAKRIEEIRRLATQMNSFTKESERAMADVQMLFGVHVYSRAKGFVDVAISKGIEAYNSANALGELSLEFLAAGGVALGYAEIGAIEEANYWLDNAAKIALVTPTPLRAWLLETWRGKVCGASGDAFGMQERLKRAVQLAVEQNRPAAKCEALAYLALEASRLGIEQKDDQLLALAERSAEEAIALVPVLPGRPLWGARAQAALTRVRTARNDFAAATESARKALSELEDTMTEDLYLEIRLPAADAILTAGSEDEKRKVRDQIGLTFALVMRNIEDDNIRAQWLQGPMGREFARLAGPVVADEAATESALSASLQLTETEKEYLRLLINARTNREIAQELAISEELVAQQLVELYAKLGTSSRATATSLALTGRLV